MKGKLVYIVLGTAMLFGYCLLAVNLYVYASDVRYIAFSSNRNGNYDIYMMDINGKNLQQLTNHPGNEFSPAFSPDGQRMAYVSSRGGNMEIYVMSVATKVSRQLTDHPGFDDNPVWSPDGQWIAFDSNRAGAFDIYKVGVSGENLQRLTHGEQNSNHPAWSSDGLIAFDSKDGIHVMDSDGANLRRLENQPRAGKTPPSWQHRLSISG